MFPCPSRLRSASGELSRNRISSASASAASGTVAAAGCPVICCTVSAARCRSHTSTVLMTSIPASRSDPMAWACRPKSSTSTTAGCPHEGLDAPGARRQLVNDRYIQLAVKRQPQCAGNGRRRHHQQMRVIAFPQELLALRHAELVLLVDDHQAKVLRREAGFDERMSADSECRALLVPGSRFPTLDFGV